MKPEHDEALVEQVASALLRNMLDPDYDEAKMLALVATPMIRTTDAARIAELEASSLTGVWAQAQENHLRYSDTGSDEDDIRFFGLGIAGEAGEVANFIKKRWRDGDGHDEDLRKECADVLAYTMMLAWKLGMSPADLVAMVAHKQQVFIEKMEARATLRSNPDDPR